MIDHDPKKIYGTTILSVRKNGKVAIAGDGQVTLGNTVLKGTAKKIRKLGDGKIIAGFAGATADAFTLFERLEEKLDKHPKQLTRACVELAKDWRMDKYLRRLEAMMIIIDKDTSLILSGNGDVIEPEDGILAIGSGGNYALSAARALNTVKNLSAKDIAQRSMEIASQICVFTNDNIVLEEL
jgi:ATP-dependent HslUV protease, peptidase subunit HslV